MQKLSLQERKELIEAAMGKRPFDLVITNVQLVNVFTGEIYPAAIGVYNGYIAHVEADPDAAEARIDTSTWEAKEVIDGQGHYLIPGLIDAHVHIESSMLTPANFAELVIPHGTTTVITDPHEIGNVLGKEGVRYMIEASEGLPMNQYILVPSSVPAVPGFEEAGAEFLAEDVAEMLEWERTIGLAEVMDFPGVIHSSDRMSTILEETLRRNLYIQGHAPTLTGRELSAYLCAGPTSDHEVNLGAEAREKLRMGMHVDARESSITRNLAAIIPAVKDFAFPPNLDFCTDDREADDLLHIGHMNDVVRRAIEEGLPPVYAIRCATYNTAQSIGLRRMGAVAPGYVADLVLVPELEKMEPSQVFVAGRLVAKDREMVVEIPRRQFAIESRNTVEVDELSSEDLKISAPIESGQISTRVITYRTEETLFSDFAIEEVPVVDGQLDISSLPDINYVAVFNRHGAGNRSLGLIQNFGLKSGAIASTVSHDSHNLTVVASNPEDGALAANTLRECGGGIVCVQDGKVKALLPLPVAGLMSTLSGRELSEQVRALKVALKEMGLPGENPVLRIASLTLPVIPKAKITDLGLFSVIDQRFVDLFVE